MSAPTPDPPPEREPAWNTQEELQALVQRLLEHQEPDEDYDETPEAWVEDRSITELRDLIEAFMAAARADPDLTDRVVGKDANEETRKNTQRVELRLRRCTMQSCECSDLDIACRLATTCCHFGDRASFGVANFGDWASFNGAVFGAGAWFGVAAFGAGASFGGAAFGDGASFNVAVFGDGASFDDAAFGDRAWFDDAAFGDGAWFDDAAFGAGASFYRAAFGDGAWFGGAAFGDGASFGGVRFRGRATFGGADISCKRFPDGRTAHFDGAVFFTDAEFSHRVDMRDAVFGPEGRLGVNGLILRAGASLVLPREVIQRSERVIRFPDARSSSPVMWMVEGAAVLLALDGVVRRVLDALGVGRRGSLIVGEDSSEYEDLRRARDDYNTLRDMFRGQPSTDDEEDICHVRYMDLKRRARWANPDKTWWGRVRVWLDWLVYRNMLGYLIQWPRIMVTGALVVLIFAAIYGAAYEVAPEGAKPIVYDGASAAEHGWDEFALNPLYFSIMSFVTLGYGDFAPIGWMKFVTGAEAFLGVSLIALFTVAWGRRMIR